MPHTQTHSVLGTRTHTHTHTHTHIRTCIHTHTCTHRHKCQECHGKPPASADTPVLDSLSGAGPRLLFRGRRGAPDPHINRGQGIKAASVSVLSSHVCREKPQETWSWSCCLHLWSPAKCVCVCMCIHPCSYRSSLRTCVLLVEGQAFSALLQSVVTPPKRERGDGSGVEPVPGPVAQGSGG